MELCVPFCGGDNLIGTVEFGIYFKQNISSCSIVHLSLDGDGFKTLGQYANVQLGNLFNFA